MGLDTLTKNASEKMNDTSFLFGIKPSSFELFFALKLLLKRPWQPKADIYFDIIKIIACSLPVNARTTYVQCF